MNQKHYDFTETLADLDAGVFSEKLSRAVKDVAQGVVAHGDGGKKGKVVIELSMSRIGESSQVAMTHKLKFDRPTKRGKLSEEDATDTALYFSPQLGLSIAPHAQTDWLKAATNNEEA